VLQKSFVAHAQVSYSYWTPHVMQDTLDQSVVNQTQDRSELEVHFHTLKDVRQLGANSSSFPSAAEVPLPNENNTCHNGYCCTELLELRFAPWSSATTSRMRTSSLIITEQYGRPPAA